MLKKNNDEEEEKIDAKLKDAQALNDESEVSEALAAKFMFLAKILDKVGSQKQVMINFRTVL